MLLCIIPPNLRLIPEILKELERERRPSNVVKISFSINNWEDVFSYSGSSHSFIFMVGNRKISHYTESFTF